MSDRRQETLARLLKCPHRSPAKLRRWIDVELARAIEAKLAAEDAAWERKLLYGDPDSPHIRGILG